MYIAKSLNLFVSFTKAVICQRQNVLRMKSLINLFFGLDSWMSKDIEKQSLNIACFRELCVCMYIYIYIYIYIYLCIHLLLSSNIMD